MTERVSRSVQKSNSRSSRLLRRGSRRVGLAFRESITGDLDSGLHEHRPSRQFDSGVPATPREVRLSPRFPATRASSCSDTGRSTAAEESFCAERGRRYASSASTAVAISLSETPSPPASRRTVSHPGAVAPSSMRAKEPVVIPARKASASRVRYRSSRSRRSAAASAGSGLDGRPTRRTWHTTCTWVHALNHMAYMTRRSRRDACRRARACRSSCA
jgi:hypothetical protein